MRFAKQRRCPECAAAIHGQAMLCPVCGHALAAQRHTEHCPACGARLEAGVQVCPICGAQRVPTRRNPSARVALVAALLVFSVGATIALASWQLGPWLTRAGGPAQAARTAWRSLRARAQELEPDPTATLRPAVRSTMTESPTVAATTTRMRTSTATLTTTPTTPAPPTSEPTATVGSVTHVVARGDLLGRIAARYGVSIQALTQANGITAESILSIGQELVIPITPTAAPTAAATAVPTVTQPVVAAVVATATPQPTVIAPTPIPTSVPPTVAPLAPTPRIHVIAKGEHLGLLAREYGVSQQAIAEANSITLNTILSIGQELVIPQPGQAGAPPPQPAATATPASNRTPLPTATPAPTAAVAQHTVAKGDTLTGLGAHYGVSSEAIAQANGLDLKAVLHIGQELDIPGVTPTATVIPAAAPITATLTLTATVRPTASPTLTRMPTPTYDFREPRLLWPTFGAVVEGEDLPVLSWTSVGILNEDVWYRIRVWTAASDSGPMDLYTKATSYRLSKHNQPQGRRLQTVRWQVQVVEHRGEGSLDMPLSPLSPEYSFVWR